MKYLLTAFFFLFGSSYAFATENTVRDSVKDTISSIVSTTKDALAGATQGVDEGRKSGESADGAYIIADKEAAATHLDISVRSVEKIADETYNVTLVLRNKSDQIVRLINLNKDQTIILLDNDGFFSLPTNLLNDANITIPEKSATRTNYIFRNVEGTPKTLRIYGQAFDIANLK